MRAAQTRRSDPLIDIGDIHPDNNIGQSRQNAISHRVDAALSRAARRRDGNNAVKRVLAKISVNIVQTPRNKREFGSPSKTRESFEHTIKPNLHAAKRIGGWRDKKHA